MPKITSIPYNNCQNRTSGCGWNAWIRYLDLVLPSSSTITYPLQIIGARVGTDQLQKRSLRALRKICGLRRVLPRSHYFPGKLSKTSNRPVSGGGTADVWRVTDDRRQIFAAKVFRANQGDDHKIKVGSPLVIWNYTTHVQTRGIIRRLQCGSG